MQIGIFAKTFAGTNPGSVLASVHDAGYSCAQYNMACSGLPPLPQNIDSGTTREIASAVKKTGVKLSAVSGTYNMIHPDVTFRNHGLACLEILASQCSAMGVSVITLCTGTRDREDLWRHHPDNSSVDAWHDLRTSIEFAIAIADRYDVFLGVEPELGNVVSSAAKAKQLISDMQSPRLKIVFDAANLFETGSIVEQHEIISHALGELSEHIIMAHAKDRLPNGAFTTAGQGCLDYAHYFRVLKASGFNGPMITHGLKSEEAASVAQFLKSTAIAADFELS